MARTPLEASKATTAADGTSRINLQKMMKNDSFMASTLDTAMSPEEKYANVMSFKDFRGFKKITNIKERYKIGHVLGEGSFG